MALKRGIYRVMEHGNESNKTSISSDVNVEKLERVKMDEKKSLIYRLYEECHNRSINYNNRNISDTEKYCNRTFDGYLCWDRTPAGTTVSQHCPNFVAGFDDKRLAHKTCLESGIWFAHPQSGKEWSNYTTCVDVEDLELRQFVNEIYVSGYCLSLTTLIISLCIFFSIRSLRCTRIRIHIQLFISLALSCIAWIVWYKFIVEVPDTIGLNPTWCVCLHLLLHYLMLVNYFWMFCEGLHLHLVLVVVFVKDAVAMRWFLGFGWILPIILVAIYGVVRAHHSSAVHCWLYDSDVMWILTVPVIISLAASIVFLINVVRILLTKLHPSSDKPAPLALRKAVRATLILVPLFGLQHLLLPLRPEAGTSFEKYYQIAAAILISLQGFSVSCLFCFANHDVIFAIKCLMNRSFPNLFRTGYGTENAPGATQSRDVIL